MTRQDFARAIRGQRKLDAETKTAGSFTLAKKTRRNKSGVVDDEDVEEWEEDDKDEDEDRSRSKQRQGPVMPNGEVLHPLSHEYQARQKMAKQRSEEKVRRLELKTHSSRIRSHNSSSIRSHNSSRRSRCDDRIRSHNSSRTQNCAAAAEKE